ncbi:MAG: dephospho-CoA kinase [Candidatus Zixiibacteriota bacterium]|nr:MAG: dephospho-CoA kinase [candidate division Zixibacteria bacterium]
MLIGITGQIGAGKTTAARILADLGAKIVDADRIGHEVVRRNPRLLKRLAARFGSSIVDEQGRLKRKKLAELAFASSESKAALDRLVHPFLLKELRVQVKSAGKRHHVVIIDAALLLDWNFDREVDYVLVVHASRETRLARLAGRSVSRRDASARERTQLPYREYQRRADRVILNNRTPADLRRKLRTLYHDLMSD